MSRYWTGTFWILILACFLRWSTVTSAAAEEPARAVLLSYSGVVELCPKLSQAPCKKASLMRLLYEGDSLALDEKAQVTVKFLKDGHRERASGKGRITISAKRCVSDGPKLGTERGFAALSAPRDKRCIGDRLGAIILREMAGDHPFEEEIVYTLTPSFSWKSDHRKVWFLLYRGPYRYDSSQLSPIWRGKMRGDRFTYPRDAASWRWGAQYHWRVVPSPSTADQVIGQGAFRLVRSQAVAKQLSEAKPRLERAMREGDTATANEIVLLYLDNKLYTHALGALKQLASLHPDDPSVHYLLAKLYYQQDDIILGDEERAKVEKFSADNETYTW
ncbi:MAG: tetratricopeptide repeat protein [Armatimonadetes bacterium]|nr:tetratricopeptide repeat protein [Armatimonadota bacterium]